MSTLCKDSSLPLPLPTLHGNMAMPQVLTETLPERYPSRCQGEPVSLQFSPQQSSSLWQPSVPFCAVLSLLSPEGHACATTDHHLSENWCLAWARRPLQRAQMRPRGPVGGLILETYNMLLSCPPVPISSQLYDFLSQQVSLAYVN